LPIQGLANTISALSIAVGALFIWELAQSWKTPLVGWFGLLLYPTFPLLLSTIGSETPLFLAFVLGGFLLYARRHYGGMVLLITLAILTRSDGVLAAVLLGGHYMWENHSELRSPVFWRKQPWFWIAAAGCLLIAWHGFAWFYFGSPLPVTLAAKQAQGRMEISQLFAPGVVRIAGWYTGGWHYWVELCLVVIGFAFAFIKRQRWMLIFAWTGLYFLAYTILGVTSYFWYYAPLVPGWVVAIGLGITCILWFPKPKVMRASSMWGQIYKGFVGFLLFSLFAAQLFDIIEMSQQIDARFEIYRAAGEWLAENTPKDATIGTVEVGIIGYYAKRTMIDFAGLIQPMVADQFAYGKTYEDASIWAVEKYHPDFILIFSNSFPGLVNGYLRSCELAHQLNGIEHNFPSDILIFDCQ
jgi:hypothetical protein